VEGLNNKPNHHEKIVWLPHLPHPGNSRSITHLESSPSRRLPTSSSDESTRKDGRKYELLSVSVLMWRGHHSPWPGTNQPQRLWESSSEDRRCYESEDDGKQNDGRQSGDGNHIKPYPGKPRHGGNYRRQCQRSIPATSDFTEPTGGIFGHHIKRSSSRMTNVRFGIAWAAPGNCLS